MRQAVPGSLPPTPRPQEGCVSWNINTACNYRCSYCTQRFKEDRGRWSRDTPRFLEAFARLPGPWEIKLSGGEPFVHPTLREIASGLAGLGHRISVVTNFSASREKLDAFIDACQGRIRVFSCSLHLEYVRDVDAFVDKARYVSERVGSLNVTTVATRDALPQLASLAERFSRAGVTFKIQPEKQDRDVISYTPDEISALQALGGHNQIGEVAPDYSGRPCWAGARYFILDDRGEAWRCYPARRFRLEPMGNFLSPDFRLADAPLPCRYRYCNCTVPISRGMMPRG
ncbi:MAG: radical SAM protein [Candidatus Xenobia bacterium]